MNYQKHYGALIARARTRVLDCYVEKHHVLPRCLDGGDEKENIVELTAEEHFCAHLILSKLHPGHKGLIFATVCMSWNLKGRRANNKLYGWLRRRYVESRTGVPRTPDEKAKVSAAHKTSEKAIAARLKLHAAQVGMTRSPEHRRKIGLAGLGRVHSDEHRAKQSAALKGKPKSAEHNANVSAALQGNQNARGAVRSEETRAKIRLAATGRKMKPEDVAKMVANKTPEQRSAAAHKAWETKRAKAVNQGAATCLQ